MHRARPLDSSAGKELHTSGESDPASLLHKIFHASPSPIAISRLSDGRLVDVNEEWASFTGHAIDDVIGCTTDELGLWLEADRYREITDVLTREDSIHDEEIDVCTKTGERRTVVLSAQRINVEDADCVLTVMTDITERKKTLQALRESEQRFHMLADSAPVLIWQTDRGGQFSYLNRSWIDFTGSSLEYAAESGWKHFIYADDVPEAQRIYDEALQKREAFEREYRLRREDGEYRWVLDKGVPRVHSDGSFAGFIGSCVDIHDKMETQRVLAEAKERAEEVSNLKANFLTNITHEIRTPLTVILGFTSILRQGVRSEYHRFVNLIERSGRRLLLMLDSMLDLAQLEAGTLQVDRQSHSVPDVVEGVVETVRPIAEEKGLDISMASDDRRCTARVDHAILARVINNVLDNAVKFTDEGEIEVEVIKDGDQIRVVISDTGIGIDDEFVAHVFDPFVQESTGLDRSHQGSGLGLSVSKRLIELMGGTITLSSRKNEGSVFTIILPAAK